MAEQTEPLGDGCGESQARDFPDSLFDNALAAATSSTWEDQLELEVFLRESGVFGSNHPLPLIDVRSPIEFNKGHIPGATNVPLFTDEQRARVGLVFKQAGRETAIRVGVRLMTPCWRTILTNALSLVHDKQPFYVCCFRGGMRSGSVAFLLREAGVKCFTLAGGYKGFRKWVLESFSIPRELCVISGRTGTGKTDILLGLRRLGRQVLDLEGEALHLGSVFGHLKHGLNNQPTTEHFENKCALQWRNFSQDEIVFIEDESTNCGKCTLPTALFQAKQRGKWVVEICSDDNDRLDRLVCTYGSASHEDLLDCCKRIGKHFGPERTAEFIAAVERDDMRTAARVALSYYDKLYDKFLHTKENSKDRLAVQTKGLTVDEQAEAVLAAVLAVRPDPSGPAQIS